MIIVTTYTHAVHFQKEEKNKDDKEKGKNATASFRLRTVKKK